MAANADCAECAVAVLTHKASMNDTSRAIPRKVLRMSRQKFMIEGEWTGYRSSQQRIVHRHYTTSKAEAEGVKAIGYGITFDDGTSLLLTVKEVSGRGLPKEIHGYNSLIYDCRTKGVSSVSELQALRSKTA